MVGGCRLTLWIEQGGVEDALRVYMAGGNSRCKEMSMGAGVDVLLWKGALALWSIRISYTYAYTILILLYWLCSSPSPCEGRIELKVYYRNPERFVLSEKCMKTEYNEKRLFLMQSCHNVRSVVENGSVFVRKVR